MVEYEVVEELEVFPEEIATRIRSLGLPGTVEITGLGPWDMLDGSLVLYGRGSFSKDGSKPLMISSDKIVRLRRKA